MEYLGYLFAAVLIVGVAVAFYRANAPMETVDYRTLVAVDASASGPLLDLVDLSSIDAELSAPDREVTWVAFDSVVIERFTPGEALRSSGGTNYELVRAFAEDPANGGFDRVIVITDGTWPPANPGEFDTWEWWLAGSTPEWLKRQPMMMHRPLVR